MALKWHGLTDAQYQDLFDRQGGGCGICGREPSAHRRLDVDHVHGKAGMGRIRGLLCHRCNRGLGFFSNLASLVAAVRYWDWDTGYRVPKKKKRKKK